MLAELVDATGLFLNPSALILASYAAPEGLLRSPYPTKREPKYHAKDAKNKAIAQGYLSSKKSEARRFRVSVLN